MFKVKSQPWLFLKRRARRAAIVYRGHFISPCAQHESLISSSFSTLFHRVPETGTGQKKKTLAAKFGQRGARNVLSQGNFATVKRPRPSPLPLVNLSRSQLRRMSHFYQTSIVPPRGATPRYATSSRGSLFPLLQHRLVSSPCSGNTRRSTFSPLLKPNFHPDKAFNEVFLILFDILKPKRLRTSTPTLRPYKADLSGHVMHFMTYISA